MPHRIFLADDHKLFRDTLRPQLERHPGLTVIGEAADGHEALRAARKLTPDLLLLDISMPNCNGIEVTRKVHEELPDTRVLILSMHSDRRFVNEALKAGAAGYVLKDSSLDELLSAILRVADGGMVLSPSLTDVFLKDYVAHAKETDQPSAFALLTSREREVLQLLAEGCTTKEIASRLNLSAKTVESHRTQLKTKLGLHSIAELTKYAIREGLTSLD